MKIYKLDISRLAQSFLDTLSGNDITNLDKMKDKMGNRFPITTSDHIYLHQRKHNPPSFIGTSYKASYNSVDLGFPLEITINETAGFATVVLKAQEILPNYAQIFPGMLPPDKFGNIAQNIESRLGNFEWTVGKLQELTRLS